MPTDKTMSADKSHDAAHGVRAAKNNKGELVQKTFGAFNAPRVEFPDLVAHQRSSFEWLVKDGLRELFKEFSPIPDYSGKKFELRIDGFEIGEPKGDGDVARFRRSLNPRLSAQHFVQNDAVGFL